MNVASNGYIVDNYNKSIIARFSQEKYEDDFFAEFDISQIRKIFNAPILIPVFRLVMLDRAENEIEDISMDFISGNLNCTYQSGKRRTLSVSLINSHKKYTPSVDNLHIYIGSKFKLYTGILLKNTIYWFTQGIFLLQDPKLNPSNSSEIANINLHDKFSMLDGTINGTTYLKTIVPEGVPIKSAFGTILSSDAGNGYQFDMKEIYFHTDNANELTCKTIKQEVGTTLGKIFIDYAKTISCDVYYNVYGNMVVESNVNDFINNKFSTIWAVEENDRSLRDIEMVYNWTKLRNEIIIKGAISNGYQFTGKARNENPMSIYNVNNSQYGLRTEVINDSKLYSDVLCEERAKYTLIERQRGVKSLVLSMGYLPFLDVNKTFIISNNNLNIHQENFVVDSFSLNCSSSPSVSVNLTNIGEVNFNG